MIVCTTANSQFYSGRFLCIGMAAETVHITNISFAFFSALKTLAWNGLGGPQADISIDSVLS
jgi:hypothetical protein